MKLHLSMLEKFIDLPSKDPQEIRHILDDSGLEVKNIEETRSGTVFTIETLANRGDHLSAFGIARELSAKLLTSVKVPAVSTLPTDRKCSIKLDIQTALCSRAAMLELVVPEGMTLPSDIAAVIGPSDKHPLIDILNYVQMEIGQPMHCWDRDKIDQEIIFSENPRDESYEALNGKSYTIPKGAIVGRDKNKIADVAGVMGSKDTMTEPKSSRVLVVSCSFDPISIRKTRRAMDISTDASYVFERGNDPEAVLFGLRRVAHWAAHAGSGGGAQVVGLTVVEKSPIEKRTVQVSVSEIRKQVHLPRLQEPEIASRLKHLGYVIVSEGEKDIQYTATVPSWRLWDVKNPEDVIEDFVRSFSLNKIKLELPPFSEEIPPLNPAEEFISQVEPTLVGSGFTEVITKGFYSAEDVRLLSSLNPGISDQHVAIRNSVESSYSHMKHTNILHLARLCESNIRRGIFSVKAFEFGRIFSRKPANSHLEFESDALTMCVAGRWSNREWRKAESLETLLFHFKGVIESVLSTVGVVGTFNNSKNPYLHPGMQSAIFVGKKSCGMFGVLHPILQSKLDCRVPILYAELDVEQLNSIATYRSYRVPADYPIAWRDMTLALPVKARAGDVSQWIQSIEVQNLSEIRIVDDFRKDGEDLRRVSYRLIFQSDTRTLETAEVDSEMQKILSLLATKHSVHLAN